MGSARRTLKLSLLRGFSRISISSVAIAVVAVLFAGIAVSTLWLKPVQDKSDSNVRFDIEALIDLESGFPEDFRRRVFHGLSIPSDHQPVGLAVDPKGEFPFVAIVSDDVGELNRNGVAKSGEWGIRFLSDVSRKDLLGIEAGNENQTYALTSVGDRIQLSSFGGRAEADWVYTAAYLSRDEVGMSGSVSGVSIVGRSSDFDALKLIYLNPEGDLVWQRTLKHASDDKFVSDLSDEGDLYLVINSKSGYTEKSARLIHIDPSGQTLADLPIEILSGDAQQVRQTKNLNLLILSKAPLPVLRSINRKGETLWDVALPEAMDADDMFLQANGRSEALLLVAHSSPGIESELRLLKFSEEGQRLSDETWRLPPNGRIAATVYAGSFWALGEFSKDKDTRKEIYVFGFEDAEAQPLAGKVRPNVVERSGSSVPQPGGVRRANIVSATGTSQIAESETELAAFKSSQLSYSGGQDAAQKIKQETVQCRFVCLIDGEPFGAWKPVDPRTPDYQTGSRDKHKQVCKTLQGQPLDEEPHCR